MRFYSMSHRDVLGLPINAFWMLDRNLSRIRADEEQRHARLLLVAQSGDQETIEGFFRDLEAEIGKPIHQQARMEKGAIDRLKAHLGVLE